MLVLNHLKDIVEACALKWCQNIVLGKWINIVKDFVHLNRDSSMFLTKEAMLIMYDAIDGLKENNGFLHLYSYKY